MIEVNYGPLPNVQLYAIVPFAFSSSREDGGLYGIGDAEFGIKYRLINEQKVIPQIGIFPLLEYPTTRNRQETQSLKIFLPLKPQTLDGI